MAATKKIASTLMNVLDNAHMQVILDRSKPIQPVVDDMLKFWSYDLYTRNPGAAYTDDGVFVGTDLDLICFMSALAERGAVINIPKYEGRRQKTAAEGEVIVSKDNRHGKILSVIANKEIFSFSIRINDANVITTDSVGNFRNFMLVDVDGTWYDGWRCIEFVPTAKENDFLTNNSLWSGSSVVFKNFVHPNRWISFYGQYYFITKALLDRLEKEGKHIDECIGQIKARGVKLPPGDAVEWPKKTNIGDVKSIMVKTLEAEIDYPDIYGNWCDVTDGLLPDFKGKNDVDLLRAMYARKKEITFSLIPKLRVAARATEYAFFKYGDEGKKMPAWIENAKWEPGFVVKGKRKEWNRLVFVKGIALRYRVWEKSEQVAAD